MARNHARILTVIWNDADFLALSPAAQRMFMALLTQPKITMLGSLDYVPKRWAAQAEGLTVDAVEEAIGELERGDYLMVDRDAEELVVRTFVRHDGGWKSPKTRAAMWSAWEGLASRVLRQAILPHLPAEAWGSEGALGAPPAAAIALRQAPPDTPSVGVPDARSDTPSDEPSGTPRNPEACILKPEAGNREPAGEPCGSASPPDGGTDDGIRSDPEIVDGLCGQLAERIETHRGGDRPKVTTAWRRDMDLLLRRGPTDVEPPSPVSAEKLRASIDAVFTTLATPTNGFCWADQVRSPGALRRHWTQLRQAERAARSAAPMDRTELARRARERSERIRR